MDAQIGRKIYYELATGNVIVDTGERSGGVIETTQEQDFATYQALAERVPETVGCIQLEYGQYAQDFIECNSFMVDVTGNEPTIIFSYPDPNDPQAPLEFQKPLSVQIEETKQAIAELSILIGGLQNV